MAKDLQTSPWDLWKCIQFAEKCDSVTELENKSWRYIAHNLLPEKHRKKSPVIPLPKGKYNIIYADPPWQYWEGN